MLSISNRVSQYIPWLFECQLNQTGELFLLECASKRLLPVLFHRKRWPLYMQGLLIPHQVLICINVKRLLHTHVSV